MTASDAIRRSVKLLQQGQLDAALLVLSDEIVVSRNAGCMTEVATMARHAAALCAGHHREREAATYYAEAALAAPMDAVVHLLLGDVHARLGEHDRAKPHWARFVELATASSDPDLREFLDLYLARPTQ